MKISDERHPEEHGHWDVADIRRLLFERDALRRELQQRRAQDNGQASEPRQQEASQAGRRLADAESKSGTDASPAQQAQPVAWRKDLNPPHGNWTLIWQAANPWPGQFHVSALYAAPPQDSARELLRELEPHLDKLICYASTPDEYAPNAIVKRIRAYLDKTKEQD